MAAGEADTLQLLPEGGLGREEELPAFDRFEPAFARIRQDGGAADITRPLPVEDLPRPEAFGEDAAALASRPDAALPDSLAPGDGFPESWSFPESWEPSPVPASCAFIAA
jgi:hypothetical protein